MRQPHLGERAMKLEAQ